MTKVLVICFVGISFLSLTCSKQSEPETAHRSSGEQVGASWKFTLPTGDPASGKQLFVELECYKCHEVKGENLGSFDIQRRQWLPLLRRKETSRIRVERFDKGQAT